MPNYVEALAGRGSHGWPAGAGAGGAFSASAAAWRAALQAGHQHRTPLRTDRR